MLISTSTWGHNSITWRSRWFSYSSFNLTTYFLLAWHHQLLPLLSGPSWKVHKHTEHMLAGDMPHVETFNNFSQFFKWTNNSASLICNDCVWHMIWKSKPQCCMVQWVGKVDRFSHILKSAIQQPRTTMVQKWSQKKSQILMKGPQVHRV